MSYTEERILQLRENIKDMENTSSIVQERLIKLVIASFELRFKSDKPQIEWAIYRRDNYANINGLVVSVPTSSLQLVNTSSEFTDILINGDKFICNTILAKYNINPITVHNNECLEILNKIIKHCPNGDYNFQPMWTLGKTFCGFYYGKKMICFQPCPIEVANDVMKAFNFPEFEDIDDCKCIIF